MEKKWDLLVVSTRLGNRNALLQILESLPVNVFIASTTEQAIEVLSKHTIRLVFCEEIFANGSPPNLLATMRDVHTEARLKLDGHEYVLIDPSYKRMMEVLGGHEAGRDEYDWSPLSTDGVELALIRALGKQELN